MSGADWDLVTRDGGDPVRTVPARDLFRQFAQAAWECADPGMQFDTTINKWHTASNTGRINGSNPCSEYMHLDNSACNLASLNLMKYLREDSSFDVEGFRASVEVIFTAQEIIVGNADYPTEKIAENSRRFRELGIGYANIGALLMAQGLPYDSDQGRAWAGAITALMTGHAYATSARTAARRVDPNATRVARASVSSPGARAKNSASFGFAPGQPPSMKVTPRWSSCSATRSLSSTVSDRPSCWEPSRRVVSKTSTADGRSGRSKSCPWPAVGASWSWSWSWSGACRPWAWAC